MKKAFSKKTDIILFVAPAFIVYCVFCLYPLLDNIYLSFFKADLLTANKYIGLRNYLKLLKDQSFIKSVQNVLIWTAICYIIQMALGLFFAFVLFQKIKGVSLFQTVFFMPSVICSTAIALLWKFVYHPNFGIINSALSAVGLESLCRNWLADEKTAIYAVVIIAMWQYIGYHMVIYLSGMNNLNPEIFEAAEIDGASKWQQFWRIMFPLLRNILRIDSVLIVTGTLKAYDLVAVTTSGGPNHATETLATYMYQQGFRNLKFGYSSAIAVVLLILCIVFTAIANTVFKKRQDLY